MGSVKSLMRRIKHPVPAAPFQRFIEDRIAHYQRMGGQSVWGPGSPHHAIGRVCQDLGWDHGAPDTGARRLYRYRYGVSESTRGRVGGKGGEHVVLARPDYERAVVEDALHHAGVLFEDVYPPEMYPALYEDIPLEAEEWCPGCQDHCTPIKAACPWCEWSFVVPELRAAA